MPIYEYYCTQCKTRFQHLARQFDAPTPTCPQCGSQEVEKLISTVNMNTSNSGGHPKNQPKPSHPGSYSNLLKHGSTQDIVHAIKTDKSIKKVG